MSRDRFVKLHICNSRLLDKIGVKDVGLMSVMIGLGLKRSQEIDVGVIA